MDSTGLATECSVLGSLKGSWGKPELIRSTGLNATWQLDVVNVSLTQSGKIGAFIPGGRVDCYASYIVNYLDEYKRSRQVQSLLQCINTCPLSVTFKTES